VAIGLNRENDTPIGGAPEFRGNMQAGEVFSVDDVPAWDGEKFAPAANSALLNAYGGLGDGTDIVLSADGTNIENWDIILPLGGSPKQVNVDDVAGTLEVLLEGDYDIGFTISCDTLVNGVSYDFFLARNGAPTLLFAEILGSNQVQSQSTGFIVMVHALANDVFSIQPTAVGNVNFTTKSISFSLARLG